MKVRSRRNFPATLACVLGLAGPAACGGDDVETTASGTEGTESTDSEGSESSDTAGSDTDTNTDTDTDGEPVFNPVTGRLRRLTASQYSATIRYLLGADAAAAVRASGLPYDQPLHDFEAIGNAELSLSLSSIEDYEKAATAAADAAIADLSTLADHVPCVVDGPQDASCYRSIAEDFGYVAWRRPLTEEEVDTIRSIGESAQAWGEDDFLTGVKYELMALLQAPSFLYMVEVGAPDEDRPELQRLTGAELATRLSFFLLGRGPSRALLDYAVQGGLDSTTGIRQKALDMLQNAEARQAIAVYYDELLHLRDLSGIGKSPQEYPQFTSELAASMREEMLRMVEDLVFEQDADIRELFLANYTYVDDALAGHYGVPAPPMGGWQKTAWPTEHGRAGFLGSAAFLTRFAHAVDTSPTRRGNFINAKFLCAEVAAPPPNVDPTLPAVDPDNPVTMKERLKQHMEDPSCAECHKYMDPIGFALENFDAIGLYRTQDLNGLPIDSTGEVEGLGAFASAKEIGLALKEDERVPACFVSNMVSGSMGHKRTSGEKDVLAEVEAAFVESNFSLQTLIVELVASDAFRYVAKPE